MFGLGRLPTPVPLPGIHSNLNFGTPANLPLESFPTTSLIVLRRRTAIRGTRRLAGSSLQTARFN